MTWVGYSKGETEVTLRRKIVYTMNTVIATIDPKFIRENAVRRMIAEEARNFTIWGFPTKVTNSNGKVTS